MTVVVGTSHVKTLPSKGLACVGQCRIHPDLYRSTDGEFQSIVDKCREECLATENASRKKYQKESVAEAHTFLSSSLGLDCSVINVDIVLSATSVRDTGGCILACFLNAGCDKVVVEAADAFLNDPSAFIVAPRERLVAHFSAIPDDFDWKQVAQLAGTLSFSIDSETAADCDGVMTQCREIQTQSQRNVSVAFQLDPNTETDMTALLSVISAHHTLDAVVSLVDPTPTQLGTWLTSTLITDRTDKLYPTVVCTRTGLALGLVYSSKLSIIAALETGRGVYYSRSRQELWKKGDTSGHFQILHRIQVDCDGDALRFTVTQSGNAFCHLNTLTCWGEPNGLSALEQTLQHRLRDAPPSSYTLRLFQDSKLLRDKLVEEAQELSEAESKQHVAEELADVLYFAMVKAVKTGVSLDDAAIELDKRARKITRRPGDSKVFRITAGDSILSNIKTKDKIDDTDNDE